MTDSYKSEEEWSSLSFDEEDLDLSSTLATPTEGDAGEEDSEKVVKDEDVDGNEGKSLDIATTSGAPTLLDGMLEYAIANSLAFADCGLGLYEQALLERNMVPLYLETMEAIQRELQDRAIFVAFVRRQLRDKEHEEQLDTYLFAMAGPLQEKHSALYLLDVWKLEPDGGEQMKFVMDELFRSSMVREVATFSPSVDCH